MDILESYIEENKVSKENILKLVDEYSLYCFYIGQELEIGVKYSSPLRPEDNEDSDPSFALYYSKYDNKQLMFKDHGNGLAGDVFHYISLISNLPFSKVLHQINIDLELGLDGKEMGDFKRVFIAKKPIIKEPVSIRVTSQSPSKLFKNYWKSLDISAETLDIFFAKDASVLHFVSKTHHKTVVPKSLCISYEIYGYYKLYQPTSKRFKFTNNFPSGYVEGAIQLRWNLPFIIITKSTKECIFYREHFNWDSVAGTSENSMIAHTFMEKLFAAYPVVFIWLDNDEPGKRAQARYLEKYPQLVPIVIDKGLVAKDATDLYLLYKKQDRQEEVLLYLRKLINTTIK